MFKKEDGSAIITVIVFITIVSFFLSIIFMYNNYQRRVVANLGFKTQTYYNAKSGLLLALQDYGQTQKTSFNYQLTGNDSTLVTIEPFGLFLRVLAVSKIKEVETTRQFLIGQKQDERFKSALVMGDVKNPVIAAGNTIIRGDVMAGPQGVKPGVLKGRRFKSEKTVFGAIKRDSKSHLPGFNSQILQSQIDLLRNNFADAASLTDYTLPVIQLNSRSMVLSNDTFLNLLEQGLTKIEGPGIIYLEGNINLFNIRMAGPLTLYSESSLTLSGNFSSNQLLCYAKNITVNSQARLSGQFYGQESINIGRGVHLTYPSIAGILSQSSKNITISENAQIDGSVLLTGLKKHKLIIEKNAVVNGITYSDNYTETAGQVNGTVLTKSFYMYMSPTVYINWINNTSIDRKYLKQDIVLPLGFVMERNYDIVIEE